MINSIKRLITKIIFHFIKPTYKFVRNSYSQAGEDIIISFLFNDKKHQSLSYLDLGTNNPDSGNNTYLFYTRGFRGICVEADKNLIDKIKKVRPEDVILNIGVSYNDNEFADFYIFNEPSISTFNKNEAEERERQGTFKITEVESVPLKNINKIIEHNFSGYPDFLSIDIEGLDLLVLKSLDFTKYPIPVICAETCTYSENHIRPKNKELIQFMLTQNYFIYADTYINTIFVNKDWFSII